MTQEKTHNGWTNYETWNVKLWIDNEEGSYLYWREAASECYEQADGDEAFTRKERASLDLADTIKASHEEGAPELTGTYADLLRAAMGEVNWYEIANSMLEEYPDERNDTEEE